MPVIAACVINSYMYDSYCHKETKFAVQFLHSKILYV